jgi:heme exporter protein B
MIGALILRDVRRGFTGAAWLPIAFFLLVATLIPFAIGPDARLLARIGPGAIWIAALTAALLPVERLIEPDRSDGVLDQLLLHGVADESVAAAKIIAHWLTFGPLLLVASFPAAALLNIEGQALVNVLLPLAVPLLIFAAANALLLEAAVSLLLTAGAPFVSAAAIRASRT